VEATADDAVENIVSGAVTIEGREAVLNNSTVMAIRIDALPIAASTPLHAMNIQVMGLVPGDGPVRITVRAEKSAQSMPLSNGERFSTRPMTAAVAVWTVDPEEWEGGAVWTSSDLSAVVGEVMALPYWKAGNAVTIFLHAEIGERTVATRDASSCLAPTLTMVIDGCGPFHKPGRPAVALA